MKHWKQLLEFMPHIGDGSINTSSESFQKALDECVEGIREMLEHSAKGRKPSISPSQMNATTRQIWHIKHGSVANNPDMFKASTRIKMNLAHADEFVLVFFMKLAGINIEAPKQKGHTTLTTPAGHVIDIYGTPDYLINGVIHDLKCTGTDSWSTKFGSVAKFIEKDVFCYAAQLYLYGKCFGKDVEALDVLLRDDCRFKTIPYKKIKKLAESQIEAFMERYDRAMEAEDVHDLPVCYNWEDTDRGLRLAWQCSRCAFRDGCFSNLREERNGEKVRHFINIEGE